MVFTVMHGSGRTFGPYFLPHGTKFNQTSYLRLLQDEVFVDMLSKLGHDVFFSTVWQQVRHNLPNFPYYFAYYRMEQNHTQLIMSWGNCLPYLDARLCLTRDPNMEEKTGHLAVLICLLLTSSSGLG